MCTNSCSLSGSIGIRHLFICASAPPPSPNLSAADETPDASTAAKPPGAAQTSYGAPRAYATFDNDGDGDALKQA